MSSLHICKVSHGLPLSKRFLINALYLLKIVKLENLNLNEFLLHLKKVPQIIKNSISDSASTVEVEINGYKQTLNLDKSHRYIGGVTQIYKDCGLINQDNSFIQKKSKWKIENGKIVITIE